MSDGDKYYPIITGPAREEALARFAAQMDAWGLTVPRTDPLVIDFCLGEFDRYGLIEYWIANEEQEGYCGKFLFVFDGQTCPFHHHALKHETFYVVKGTVRMKIGDEERELAEGEILAMPPGVPHSFTGVGPALLLEASKPCRERDNIFADKRIGDQGVV